LKLVTFFNAIEQTLFLFETKQSVFT